jgi:uncharacterized protein YndB with AHSA1/START domain
MPRASASRELLAPRDDVWAFIAEPHHFPDWWPGIAGVRPDRRGFAEGARWQVQGTDRPTLFRRATSSGLFLIRTIDPPRRFAWTLTGNRIDAELRLEEASATRTIATLELSAPWLFGFSRGLPGKALTRLHALCQTAAEL